MSNSVYEIFIKNCQDAILDKENYTTAQILSQQYISVLENSHLYYKKYGLAKNRAFFQKYKVAHDLHHHIIEFEKKFIANGGRIIYAEDNENALKEILKIVKKIGTKQYLFSNSITLEEVEIKKHLKDEECTFTEWDAYIKQLNGKKKKSLAYPSLTLNLFEALKIVKEKNPLQDMSVNQVLDFVKKNMINKAYQNSVSFSGANFLVADCGAIALLEEEGNIQIGNAFSEVQIIVAGIDKFIPSLNELELYTSLLSTHTCAKAMPYQQSLLFGPKKDKEIDGPSQMYLILVDNGRTRALAQNKINKTFACINCGACSAVCPVYKFIGYNQEKTHFKSPIENIKAPYFYGFHHTSHLNFACTLCGYCEKVCPVCIPLPELILENRKLSAQKKYFTSLSKTKIKRLKKMLLKRKIFESSFHRYFFKIGLKKAYGNKRSFPDFNKKSFHILYQDVNKICSAN